MCKSKPKVKSAPPPAAPPVTITPKTAEGVEGLAEDQGENVKRRKRRAGDRSSLRIDVNVVGLGGQGLNIPR